MSHNVSASRSVSQSLNRLASSRMAIDEKEEEEEKEKVKIIPKEDQIMTKEELEARNRKRLAMSGCCVAEAWALYRKLIGAPRDPSVPRDLDLPDPRPLSVLYDPDVDKRLAFLGRKYHYMLQGFYKIKEAPSKPYIRPQPPRDLDVDGRHKWMACSVRVQMPEVDTDHSHPLKVSAKGQTLKIFNKSFADDEDVQKDEETQTWRRDFQAMSRRWGKKKDWVSTRDIPLEDFDLEDYPIDGDGNPVGKSTGQCEWCRQDILPLPTPYTLRNTWDKPRLYCCQAYMACCVEADEFEAALRAELEAKNRFINVDPHRNIRKKRRTSLAVATSTDETTKTASVSKSRSKEFEIKSYRKEMDAAYHKERRQKMMLKKVEEWEEKKRKDVKNKAVDTYDLPWDPYETRFGHPRFFNNQVFDESEFHSYPHADVVLSQSGIYGTETTTKLADSSSR